MFLTATIKRDKSGPVLQKPVLDFWLFVPKFSFNLLKIFDCFWLIHLSKTSDESIVQMGIACSAGRDILLSPRRETICLLQKNEPLFQWLVRPRQEIHKLFELCSRLEPSNKNLTNVFPSTLLTVFFVVKPKHLEILDIVQGVYSELFDSFKNQRYRKLVVVCFWPFISSDLSLKRNCWYCYCCSTSWIEYY